jgi:gliding motility-associated-like protein
VTATDANGCTSIGTTSVTVVDPPQPVIEGSETACAGNPVMLTVLDSYSNYAWNTGANSQQIEVAAINGASFTVTVTEGGCTGVDSITISAAPLPNIVIEVGAGDINGYPVVVTGADAYVWSPEVGLSCFNCDQLVANPGTATTYCVTGTLNGCEATDCVTIEPAPQCPVYIPNVFKRFAGNFNDRFCLFSSCTFTAHIYIFDRWGNLLQELEGSEICWDGTYKGEDLLPGVYVYRAEITTDNGVTLIKAGDITIVE